MKFIALCTPSLGTVSLHWAASVFCLQWPNNIGRVCFFVRDDEGNSIAETRNKIVSLALSQKDDRNEISHLFWVDDDVLVDRMALYGLYGLHKPIASGVYFTKADPGLPLMYSGVCEGSLPFVPDQTLDVWGHGMGLCLVEASVYQAMEPNLPKDKNGNPEWYKTQKEPEYVDGVLMGAGTEDLYFCDLAGKAGFPSTLSTHRWAFGWHFDKDRQQGYPVRQWNQRRKAEPVTWQTDAGEVVWR